MHHLIYMSRATVAPTDVELATILKQAQQNNSSQGITGALVYGAEQFMQIIEGPEAALAGLYAKLLADPRHYNVVKLADKQVPIRSFADWSMAFYAASPEQFATLTGYVEPEQLEVRRKGLSAADGLLLEMMKSFVLTPRP